MHAITMVEDVLIGDRLNTVEHACADVDQAWAALDRLDGKTNTSLAFRSGADMVLTVGGGGGRFVVFVARDVDAELFTLIDPAKSADHDEDVVAGGQLGSYPADQVVGREMAREAVAWFCEQGLPAPHLCWQRE